MRRTTKSAAVVGASMALVAGFSFGTAEAFTAKELKACWTSKPAVPNLAIVFTADGPSFRQNHLVSGECRAWDVRPGSYKIVVDTADEVREALFDNAAALCPGPTDAPVLLAKIRRFDKTYRTFHFPFVLGGDADFFRTDVKKDRRTSVSFSIACR